MTTTPVGCGCGTQCYPQFRRSSDRPVGLQCEPTGSKLRDWNVRAKIDGTPLPSYRKYFGTLLWQRTMPGSWREKALECLSDINASCFYRAAVHLMTLDQWRAFEAVMDETDCAGAVTPGQARDFIITFGLSANVTAVLNMLEAGPPMTGVHTPVRMFDNVVETGRSLVLLQFTDVGKYEPHWVYATSVYYGRTVRMNSAELHFTETVGIGGLGVSDDPVGEVIRLLTAPLVDGDEYPDWAPEHNYQVARLVADEEGYGIVDLFEVADAESFFDTADDYGIADLHWQPVPQDGVLSSHWEDRAGLAGHENPDAQKRGVESILRQVLCVVGLHPPPCSSDSSGGFREPEFYYLGSGPLPAFRGWVTQGMPSRFTLFMCAGLWQSSAVLWELCPAVLSRGIVYKPGDLAYVQMDVSDLRDKRLMANGCFNPDYLHRLQAPGFVFDLDEAYETEFSGKIFRFFRIVQLYVRPLAAIVSKLPFSFEVIKETTHFNLEELSMPLQSAFCTRRAYLRCCFTLLAAYADDTLRGVINDQRNQVLAEEIEGRLPLDYDPAVTVRAVVQMAWRAKQLMGVAGASPWVCP